MKTIPWVTHAAPQETLVRRRWRTIYSTTGDPAEPPEDVEGACAAEIERRIRQIDSGEVKTILWEEVRAKLYARLNGER